MTLPEILQKFSKNRTNVTVTVDTFDSPIGKIVAAADDDSLYIVTLNDSKNIEKPFRTVSEELSCNFTLGQNKILNYLKCEIQDYFDGKMKKFSIPIKLYGSDFQKEVWSKLREIPYGSTLTYGTLAKELGRSASHSRAVGGACGANHLLLIVPCHRIVASGSKGGFSCGLDRKDFLITHKKKLSY